MTKYWFKPKRYGYGATPITWQGWAATAASVIATLAALLLTVHEHARSPAAWVVFVIVEALIIAALIVVCRRKTEGELRWRWGDD